MEENKALDGGALFADDPCQILFSNTRFVQNRASQHGAAIATGDGVKMEISRSHFLRNGISSCQYQGTPEVGSFLF